MTARVFRRDSAFYDARQELESQSGEWLTEAVRVVEDHMGEWLSTRLDTRKGTSHKICLLNALRRMGIEILERSGLVTGQGEDMMRLRSQIASCIGRADEFTSAINKVKDKTIDDYASDIRSSLERTGYVYEAAHRLGVLTCAMLIDSDLMVKNIRLLFGTLSSRSLTDWRQDTLTVALRPMCVSVPSTSCGVGACEALKLITSALLFMSFHPNGSWLGALPNR